MYKGTQKNSNALHSIDKDYLKYNLTSLQCIQYNEINKCYYELECMFTKKNFISSINISYAEAHNKFQKRDGECLETAESIFSGLLDVLFLSY